MMSPGRLLAIVAGIVLGVSASCASGQEALRVRRFGANTADEAVRWQQESRRQLVELMMGGGRPEPVALDPKVIGRSEVTAGGYALEEVTFQSLPDRRVHAWLAVPNQVFAPATRVGAVLALHGHGGSGEQVVRGEGLYWYGRALAEMGYVVIAPDIGSHELQHEKWSLMGERVWDAIRAIDYLQTRPEVDPQRIAVAGLSLGGETTMYVAALDERVVAACSSGWLTTIANMKQGHCPCWNFPGLEEHFDFADIFACCAPRPLVVELGEQEKSPGGFPVEIGRQALAEIQRAYHAFGASDRLTLDVHPGGHVFHGQESFAVLRSSLKASWPWEPVAQTGAPVAGSSAPEPTNEALRRGEIARRLFCRALGVLDGWWALRDRELNLFPRRVDQPVWAPQDNAADMLPFLFLTAHFLAPDRIGEISQALESEQKLTNRLGPMPDWYSLAERRFVHESPDVGRIIFNAAEYCKDGLIPMTEVMGDGPWTRRMVELMDAIFAHAPVASQFGPLPSDDIEVNGDILQVLARLYALKREAKYLDWAERIGDAYCLEVLPTNGGLPPHRWDFGRHQAAKDTLNLNDHGNELIGGLAELFVITQAFNPEKAAQYREPLRSMFHRLLATARNEDGLWFNLVTASTGQPLQRATPDTWGYALAATLTFGRATEDGQLLAAVEKALRNIDQPRYLMWNGADAYADSIEGGLLLLNRLPAPEGFSWFEKMLPIFLGKQRGDGIVEGWYGDGNYARTALMAGLYCTQGTQCRTWRQDLRLGAVSEERGVRIVIQTEHPWEGTLHFDLPRHRLHLRLPVNYPRLNEFPEWFTIESETTYRVRIGTGDARSIAGKELAQGLPLLAASNQLLVVSVAPEESGTAAGGGQ